MKARRSRYYFTVREAQVAGNLDYEWAFWQILTILFGRDREPPAARLDAAAAFVGEFAEAMKIQLNQL